MNTPADPSAMTPEKLERPMALMSRASIVDTGDGCLYASSDGLASVGSSGGQIVTKDLISPEQWRAYNPSSMVAAVRSSASPTRTAPSVTFAPAWARRSGTRRAVSGRWSA